MTYSHSLGMIRAFAPLRNVNAWYEAFFPQGWLCAPHHQFRGVPVTTILLSTTARPVVSRDV